MKKLVSFTLIASLVLTSAVYASESFIEDVKSVDVVAAATNAAPAPAPTPAPTPTPTTKPTTKPAPAPTTKPTTTTPAASATATQISRILKYGSKGADVKLLQTLLVNNGYTLTVDGIFGNQTLKAVKDYQSKNGLKVDGIVGSKTLAKLNATAAPSKLTISKANDSIQNKTFKGDVYVRAANFQLVNAVVDGNIYFVTQEAKDTFKMDANSKVTGNQILADIDAVSTASIVSDAAAFEKAISKDGAWIITTLRDLVIDKALVVEGTFYDKNDTTKALKRKIGLYTHNDPNDKKKATHSFTLTAPSLTIKSPSTTLQYGTFVGDIYVRADNFNLTNTKVDGNIYFVTQSAKDTFTNTNSTVTGELILADVDAVSTASIVSDAAAFEKAISKDGAWIITTLRDLVIDKALVVEGTFYDKNDTTKALKRKIGLYTHNDPNDKKKATHSFTLTAPSLTIKSPSTTLQYGTFVGDIYVRADNFNLTNTKVDGNIYFVTQSAKDTFTNTNSTVTGELILADVDAVSTASIVSDAAAFEKAISKDGNWIIATLRDLVIDKELVVEGTFYDKNDTTKALKRKIGLYTHNNPEDKKIATHSFTLKVPKLTVKSPSTTLQYGTFIGDIYVESNNFNITNTKVDGNIYFATQEAMDSFTNVNSEVTGVVEVKAN